jgi:ATP-dependent DNA ligase
VHLGTDGTPAFYDLMRRRRPHHYYAFDLLWLDGQDLRDWPLVERKRLLRQIVPQRPAPVLYVDHVVAAGVDLYDAICGRDMEGVVAKLAHGAYTPEATTWVKIKNPVYSQAEARGDFFDVRAGGRRSS